MQVTAVADLCVGVLFCLTGIEEFVKEMKNFAAVAILGDKWSADCSDEEL